MLPIVLGNAPPVRGGATPLVRGTHAEPVVRAIAEVTAPAHVALQSVRTIATRPRVVELVALTVLMTAQAPDVRDLAGLTVQGNANLLPVLQGALILVVKTVMLIVMELVEAVALLRVTDAEVTAVQVARALVQGGTVAALALPLAPAPVLPAAVVGAVVQDVQMGVHLAVLDVMDVPVLVHLAAPADAPPRLRKVLLPGIQAADLPVLFNVRMRRYRVKEFLRVCLLFLEIF